MKLKLLFFAIGLTSMQAISAQTADDKFAIGLGVVGNEYNGEYGNGLFNFNRMFPAGGLTLGYYLSPSFDLGLQSTYGNYGYTKDAINRFSGLKLDGSLFAHYKLNNGYILSKESKLSPFVSLGLGLAGYSTRNDVTPATIITKGVDFVVPAGLGLKYQITKSFALQYQYLYNFTSSDVRDQNRSGGTVDKVFGMIPGAPADKAGKDVYGQHVLSLVFKLGKLKDSDKDGVSDKFDKCIDTPLGVTVGNDGCPLDGDGDGVADYLDKCADTPAGVKVNANGCPVDSDKDGVADYLDKCVDTPAGVKVDANGCPLDSDKDGVADYLDKCPNTPAGTKVNTTGCPLDSDGDGVVDAFDKCANTPKGVKVDASGCPLDSDKDGVADYLDKCPDVPGIAANKGCPEIKEETKKVFAQALQGIQFESGKDVIKKTSYGILNKVVAVMQSNPSYNLEINGHTDSQGDDMANQLLSQKRADAVKAYLVKNGVPADKLSAKGFGETAPVADNATAAGRAKNRRVEFKVNF